MSRYVPPGPLGMGGAPLGNLFARIPEEVAAATVQAAWDAGIRHYDNAPHYGAGLSEHRMGAVLRLHPRTMFALSTKVGRILEAADNVPEHDEGFVGALPFRRRIDYSAAGTHRSIEDSLQRMGLSRIDIVYIHDVSADWHGPAWTYRFAEAMAGAVEPHQRDQQRRRNDGGAFGRVRDVPETRGRRRLGGPEPELERSGGAPRHRQGDRAAGRERASEIGQGVPFALDRPVAGENREGAGWKPGRERSLDRRAGGRARRFGHRQARSDQPAALGFAPTGVRRRWQCRRAAGRASPPRSASRIRRC